MSTLVPASIVSGKMCKVVDRENYCLGFQATADCGILHAALVIVY